MRISRWLGALAFCAGISLAQGAAPNASIRYDTSARVFTLSAPHVSYAFGINERSELQALHWGGRVADDDSMAPALVGRDHSSFEPSTDTVPQEYPGWGSAFYTDNGRRVLFGVRATF